MLQYSFGLVFHLFFIVFEETLIIPTDLFSVQQARVVDFFSEVLVDRVEELLGAGL